MYIEKEALLVKKVLGKKISTSLLRSSEEDASEKITDKEVAFWKEQR